MKKKNISFLIIGLIILFIFLLMAFFPTIFTSYDRKESFEKWLSPSKYHLLGTNHLGYDIYTELVYGAKETIIIGVLSSIISLFLGIVIGILAANKSFIGSIFNGLINIFVLLPKLITLIVLASFLKKSTLNIILLISFFTSINIAKSIRSKIIHIKSQTYIDSCNLYGYSKMHTTIYHILPNLKDVIISKFLVSITSCIMMESTLSFLGLGNIYYPTWGVMISLAKSRGALLRNAYNYLLSPCICIMLLSLSFYFIYLYIDSNIKTIQD